MVRAGVASLKIEGRLKSPEYVASITRIYRTALDAVAASPETSAQASVAARPGPAPTPCAPRGPASSLLFSKPQREHHTPQYRMEMAFSRGLYTGWFRGADNQQLVHGRFGKKRGVYLGEVLAVRRDCVLVGLAGPLQPGDGVVFDAGQPEEKEQGGRVYQIRFRARGSPGPGPRDPHASRFQPFPRRPNRRSPA